MLALSKKADRQVYSQTASSSFDLLIIAVGRFSTIKTTKKKLKMNQREI